MTDIPAAGYAVILLPDGARSAAAWGPLPSREAAGMLAEFITAEVDPAVVVPLQNPAGPALAWWEQTAPLLREAYALMRERAGPDTDEQRDSAPYVPDLPSARHQHTYTDQPGGGLRCSGCPASWSAVVPGGHVAAVSASGRGGSSGTYGGTAGGSGRPGGTASAAGGPGGAVR